LFFFFFIQDVLCLITSIFTIKNYFPLERRVAGQVKLKDSCTALSNNTVLIKATITFVPANIIIIVINIQICLPTYIASALIQVYKIIKTTITHYSSQPRHVPARSR